MTEQTVQLRVDHIRDAIKEQATHWAGVVEVGLYNLKVVRGTKEKLEKYWPEVTTAGKPEDDGTFMMFVDFEDVHYYVKWRVVNGQVEVDYPEECALVKAEEPIPEKNDIEKAFDTLKAAMTSDPGYLWSWVCNVACPIMDSGVEHGKANKAAARLLAHLFKVDVTEMPEYKDVIARTSKDPAPVEEMDAEDPSVNTIHVTITGFDSNSGAEALSRYIHDLLASVGQYNTKLNIADTTLYPDGRSASLPKKANTLIYVTGVESRYHTDRHGAAGEDDVALEEGIDSDCDADCFDAEDPCAYGDDTGPFGPPTESKGKLTINLKVDDNDLNPLSTIEYFRTAYMEAHLNVDITPNPILTDEIAKHARMIALQESAAPESEPVGSPVNEVYSIDNAVHRHNAYVFEKDTESDRKEILVLHVAIDTEDFHPELFVGNGVRIVQTDSVTAMAELLNVAFPDLSRYSLDLFVNNERWLNRFGDGTEVVMREHEGPFTLFNISQDSIPKTIYSEVEECWTAFQNIDRLGDLAEKLNDPTIVINVEDYAKVTRGAMVLREHPRLDELFVKYLQYKAQFNPCIGRWLRSYGK